MGCSNIDCINTHQQFIIRVAYLGNMMSAGKLTCFVVILIKYTFDFCIAHKCRLWDKALCDSTCTNHTYSDILLQILTEHRRRNPFRSRQIDYLTEFFQIVELTFPVRSDSKDINFIFLYIINLLTDIIFNDDFVCQTCCPDCIYALQHIILHIQLSPLAVKVVVGHTYYQVVTQRFRPSQKVDMSLMQ